MNNMSYKPQAFFGTIRYKMSKFTSGTGQKGFVSIFSVIIIMAILTLLTIGFTTVTRRAQRNTLDNQQNTQAFYAAESGVNDAARAIQATSTYSKTTCDGDPVNFVYTLNAATNVGYTCVLVDATPPRQTYDSVPVLGTGEPVIATLASEGGQAITSVRISWDSPRGLTDPLTLPSPNTTMLGGSPNLPPATAIAPALNWGNRVGMLRVDLVPISSLSRANLVNNSFTFFLLPSNSGATSLNALSGTDNQAGTLETNCGATVPRCVATINLFTPGPATATANRYRMRLTSYYQTVRVPSIEILNGAALLDQIDGQALIDSTGKSGDVFRRIQVTLPLRPSLGYHDPFSILTAGDICKRLLSAPSAFAVIDAPVGTYPACQVP